MPTTNEAPAAVNYEDAETASLAKLVDQQTADIAASAAEASREEVTTAPEEKAADGQAKVDAASSEPVEPVVEPTPDGAGEATGEPVEDDFEWAPEELKTSLVEGKSAGALTQAALDKIKSNYMKARGFDKGMRDNAATRKDNEGLIADGENFRKLMESDQMRADWVAFLEAKEQPAEETIPEFETDAELAQYTLEKSEKAVEGAVQAEMDRRFVEPQQKADTLVRLAEEHMESLGDVPPDVFNKALELMNAEIRGGNELPWDVLTDSDVFSRRVGPHLQVAQLTAELDALRSQHDVSQNEKAKSEAAGAASATSPPGRSTVTPTTYPDTPAGRAEKTLAELGNATILD